MMRNEEPERLVLSDFQMDSSFGRNFRFRDMCLVRRSALDWGVAHRKGTDTSEVLIFKNAKKSAKSYIYDPEYYIWSILKIS